MHAVHQLVYSELYHIYTAQNLIQHDTVQESTVLLVGAYVYNAVIKQNQSVLVIISI